MLQRRTLSAARLLLNGEAAALAQGFARQQHWQQGGAAAAACPPPLPSGLRWHSELAERPKDQPEAYEYVAPFGTAVGRVKVRAWGGWCAVSRAGRLRRAGPQPCCLCPPRRSCRCSAAPARWVLPPSSWGWMRAPQ